MTVDKGDFDKFREYEITYQAGISRASKKNEISPDWGNQR
jgi:hypothetical protein